jgi:hypothetical protein
VCGGGGGGGGGAVVWFSGRCGGGSKDERLCIVVYTYSDVVEILVAVLKYCVYGRKKAAAAVE